MNPPPRVRRYVDNIAVRYPSFYPDNGGPGWYPELQYPTQTRLDVRYNNVLGREVYIQLNAVFFTGLRKDMNEGDVLDVLATLGVANGAKFTLLLSNRRQPDYRIAIIEFPTARQAEDAIVRSSENRAVFRSREFRARYSEINGNGPCQGSLRDILLVREEFALTPLHIPTSLSVNHLSPRHRQAPPSLPSPPPSAPPWNAVGFARDSFQKKRKSLNVEPEPTLRRRKRRHTLTDEADEEEDISDLPPIYRTDNTISKSTSSSASRSKSTLDDTIASRMRRPRDRGVGQSSRESNDHPARGKVRSSQGGKSSISTGHHRHRKRSRKESPAAQSSENKSVDHRSGLQDPPGEELGDALLSRIGERARHDPSSIASRQDNNEGLPTQNQASSSTVNDKPPLTPVSPDLTPDTPPLPSPFSTKILEQFARHFCTDNVRPYKEPRFVSISANLDKIVISSTSNPSSCRPGASTAKDEEGDASMIDQAYCTIAIDDMTSDQTNILGLKKVWMLSGRAGELWAARGGRLEWEASTESQQEVEKVLKIEEGAPSDDLDEVNIVLGDCNKVIAKNE
ncbi:hypothetical protein CI109_107193 [Kwoniella shandongensis]|uniref:Uncharacterized protein n=1 Tax=Kwoniella shandongensis TaxID=1734106 RepID=A0A5M6C6N5_9TREE|nr:uncharacterized protein CI109_002476 [Kwoniella shandongensis]KAA5529135.1 hypothetical protein CI109_002476 [Kwoniella shandongensis]